MITDDQIKDFKIEPRDYQRRIVKTALDMYGGTYVGKNGLPNPPFKSVMVESPTGSGKTVMGFMTAKLLQAQSTQPMAIGWIAMRRNLLTQAQKENDTKGFDIKNIHYISMFDKRPQELLDLKNAGHKVLFVVDECHHDAASSMVHLHNLIKPDHVLGLSATPYRTDKTNLCFEKVIKDCGIHQLIQLGYLSPYDHYTIDNWKPDNVISHYCMEPERWGKSVFFFKNIEECNEASLHLSARGYKSEVVTGESDSERQIDDFQTGKVNILINCMKLTEGFDCPDIKTVWVRDSGKGPTTQMAGRVFRKHPMIDRKQVVQSKQTRWPCLKTAMSKVQYAWQNGEWLSLTINPKIDAMVNSARMAIALAPITIPAALKNLKKSSRRSNPGRRI